MKIRLSTKTWIILVVSVLLLGLNAVFGTVMIRQSRSTMRELLQGRMLDVSNSAAALLDGDVLGSLRAEDKDTPQYRSCEKTLRTFQESIELRYIYAVNIIGDGTFTFNIDPSDEPGEFGSPVAYTDALYRASQGIAGVDEVPYTDAWGRFYSAYSPVFGSDGRVTAIVAVDFDADWYDQHIRQQTLTILLSSLTSLAVGILVTALITERIRRRLVELYREMNGIYSDVGQLMQEIRLPEDLRPETAVAPEENRSDDRISAIRRKLNVTRQNLLGYIAYLRAQSYLDVLTGIGNRTSYLERVKELDEEIQNGHAAFSLVIADVNNLKGINDTYGHDEGDRILVDAGHAIRTVFGTDSVYRIGGDEFTAVTDCTEQEAVQALVDQLQQEVAQLNAKSPRPDIPLELSCGSTVFNPTTDCSFRDVFLRADKLLYQEKAAYYATRGDRRRTTV